MLCTMRGVTLRPFAAQGRFRSAFAIRDALFVPFEISETEAKKRYENWTKRNFLFPDEHKKAKNLTKSFLPFFIVDVTGTGSYTAEVGQRNFSGGDLHTRFSHVAGDFDIECPNTPVYAS
ncbi:MAG: hypothetical protein MHM6MM_009217, partial [Cercozoa sp. M6MM]